MQIDRAEARFPAMSTLDITPIDLSPYLRSPMFSVQEGISLARALVSRCPREAPALVKRAASKLKRAAEEAQSALSARQREENQQSEEDSRLLDQEMDAAWGGLRLRLEGYASLSRELVPRAGRAAELLAELFGSEGLSFLKVTYSAQLATMQALLQRIAEDKLDKELDALCGPEFLARIHALLPRYERMVHAALSRKSGPAENLLSYRNALSRAVLGYATAICATVDEQDSETVEQALAALAPLAGQRTAVAARRSATDSPEPPPAPDASPAPPAA